MGALLGWLHGESHGTPAAARDLPGVDELRRRCVELLADCQRPHDERIRGQLAGAATPQQLWLMRCEIYQAVARQHCEAEAARRINGLLPLFEGWLPPAALTRL